MRQSDRADMGPEANDHTWCLPRDSRTCCQALLLRWSSSCKPRMGVAIRIDTHSIRTTSAGPSESSICRDQHSSTSHLWYIGLYLSYRGLLSIYFYSEDILSHHSRSWCTIVTCNQSPLRIQRLPECEREENIRCHMSMTQNIQSMKSI